MEKSSENKVYRAIGLMSGTAMDGIDAAMIETDGYGHINRIGFESLDHTDELRHALRGQLNKTTYDPMVESAFTLAQIPVIEKLLSVTGFEYADIDVLGFHGQTTHHDPDNGLTVQMGNGQLLSDKTGVDVVFDFRKNDMKQGGQGAPFLPVYHQALAKNAKVNFPIVVLNLGGVGNITWISDDDMIAFDTGPANAMIDDWVKTHTGDNFDNDGALASKGTVDETIVDAFLSHDYFSKPYPKSLDRNDFQNISVVGMSVADGAATLTAMTVQSVAKGIDLCPSRPTAIYVTGGGRHNGFMMGKIEQVTKVKTASVDSLGWNGDSIESEGFAYMAMRSLLGQPISFPNTTGCAQPTTGGVHVTSKRNAA